MGGYFEGGRWTGRWTFNRQGSNEERKQVLNEEVLHLFESRMGAKRCVLLRVHRCRLVSPIRSNGPIGGTPLTSPPSVRVGLLQLGLAHIHGSDIITSRNKWLFQYGMAIFSFANGFWLLGFPGIYTRERLAR